MWTPIVPLLCLAACSAPSATPQGATGGTEGASEAPGDSTTKGSTRPPVDATSTETSGGSDRSAGAQGGSADGGGASEAAATEGGDRSGDALASDPGRATCPAEIAPGRYHVCSRKPDGALWCWGGNNHGQLGAGTAGSKTSAVRVDTLANAVVALSSDYSRTCVVKSDGTVWCWGETPLAGAGGASADVPVPTQVTGFGDAARVAAGRNHTCARKRNGTLWCWGKNNSGQLGDGTTTDRPPPVEVTALGAEVVSVSAGGAHTCAIKTDGTLWCWGGGGSGQVGAGTAGNETQPVKVSGVGTGVAEVAAGGAHTCAVKTDGTLWCWGFSNYGQVGDGTMTTRLSPVQVTALGAGAAGVSTGIQHTCARKRDGTLWCWGMGDFGQLGDGTDKSKSSPVQVTSLGNGVADVSLGQYFTCATKGDNTAWCWGESRDGQLGHGGRGNDMCFYIAYGRSFPCERLPVRVVGLCP